METNRQKKIAGVIQQDLAEVIQRLMSDAGRLNVVVSVTKVRVTADLSLAKAYLSIFPTSHAKDLMADIHAMSSLIKHEIAQRTKHQFRRMPNLEFYTDDSLEYIDQIDRSLKGLDNPIEHPELLKRRKKK
ncbi:MAG: 30S ribosome-binding factor RbfA [Flavobacteriaceae bacterium]|nr:30S ribosome-binding factor RbfA [Bacteroidia bacterium]NNF75119.1 30S ribosome-binding factor RbfA [Flavobacteriaceae bacterium]NNK72600.1 30S ribosome-binding factor RbfA [Flavobacteriaceae bacterium]